MIYIRSVPEPADPIARFQDLFARAADNAPFDPVAVTLATASPDGRPSARIVLLRRVDANGFGFFTNYQSRKGRELLVNPHGAICAYWPWLDEQARIEGPVTAADPRESDGTSRAVLAEARWALGRRRKATSCPPGPISKRAITRSTRSTRVAPSLGLRTGAGFA